MFLLSKISIFLFVLGLSQVHAAGVLYRPQTQTLDEKAWEVDFGLRRFSTTSYFDVDGENIAMNEEDSYALTDLTLDLRYGYGTQLEIRGQLRGRQIQSDQQPLSVSKMGAESGLLAFKYSFPRPGPFRYALEASVRTTFYSNDLYDVTQGVPTDEIVLGDSGTSFLLGGFLSYQKPRLGLFEGSLFYHRAPGNLSDEILYEAQALIPFSRLRINGGLRGVFSLAQDEYAQAPNLKPQFNAGATSLFNSINRSYTKAFVGGAFAFQSFTLAVEAARVMMGTSTDEGNEIAFNIIWNRSGITSTQRKVESFKEYNIEASVIRVSPRGKFIKIDKGMAADLRKGMTIDIFKTDFFGGNELVATGIVFEITSDSAIVRLERVFGNNEVKRGFIARAR